MKRIQRLLIVFLSVFAGLILLLTIVIQLALSPSLLKKIVDTYAPEYIEGELKIGDIKASAIKSFPHLNISVDSVSLVYPTSIDTLGSAKRLSLSINYLDLINGEINIREATAKGVRVFVSQYDSTFNWDVFKSSDDDTSSMVLPPIEIRQASLNSVYLEYASDSTNMTIELPRCHLRGRKDGVYVNAKADAYISMVDFGSTLIPLSLSGIVNFPNKDISAIGLRNLNLKAAMVEMEGNGDLVFEEDSIYVRAEAAVKKFDVGEVAKWIGKDFYPQAKKLSTDAVVSFTALCDGYYVPSTGALPELIAELIVPKSYIKWKGVDYKGEIKGVANASTDKYGNLSVNLNELDLDFAGICVVGAVSAEDLTGKDPMFGLNLAATASFDELGSLLPKGYAATGKVEADFNGLMFMSDIDLYNFALADIDGGIKCSNLLIDNPKDSLFLLLNNTNIRLEKLKDSELGADRLGLRATVDSLNARYGAGVFARGSEIEFTVQNSEQTESEEFGHEIHPIVGTMSAKGFAMTGSDSLFIGVMGTKNSFRYSSKTVADSIEPLLAFKTNNDAIFLRNGYARGALKDAEFNVSVLHTRPIKRQMAENGIRIISPEDKEKIERRPRRREVVKEDDFTGSDFSFSLGETMSKYFREWRINGSMNIGGGRLITPYFPILNNLETARGSFTNDSVVLDSLCVKSGSSDIMATGQIYGIRGAVLRNEKLNVNLSICSSKIDANELLAAYDAGSKFVPQQATGDLDAMDESVSNESYLNAVVADSLLTQSDSSSLFVVPANINATLNIEGNQIDWADLEIGWFSSEISMHDRCLQIVNTVAESNVGDIYFEGFYSTTSKEDIKAGFDLNLASITADKVISLVPATDSIMPMLKSFKGVLDCEIVATSYLDTMMNFLPQSIQGMMVIKGRDLELEENEALESIAKTLMLKDRKVGKIDDMMVTGIINDNTLEIFPFVMGIERYTLAMSGIQNFDQSFKYHLSVLKSPIPFRFGINFTGNFDDWNFKVGKARYKNDNVPVFTSELSQMKANLVDAIHNIFTRGVDMALKSNADGIDSMNMTKEKLGYDSSHEAQEELSEEEKSQMEQLKLDNAE